MPVRLQMDGLAEFRDALRQLPDDLAQEAGAIVSAHAEDAERRIERAYPEGPTGNLRRGVTVSQGQHSRFGASAIVRSRAKHASLWEKGTKMRRTRTGQSRGAMPQPPESNRMIPIVIRVRAQMVRSLIALVRRAGFVVGEA